MCASPPRGTPAASRHGEEFGLADGPHGTLVVAPPGMRQWYAEALFHDVNRGVVGTQRLGDGVPRAERGPHHFQLTPRDVGEVADGPDVQAEAFAEGAEG